MPRKSQDDQQEREMEPIPDGGLSSSMPDWLRRPPAWRSLPDREVVQTTTETATSLPNADTSEIDPRTFIHDDDLPEWLRSLRRPAPVPPGDVASTLPEDAQPPTTASPSVDDADVETSETGTSPPAFRPRRPPMPEVATGARSTKSELQLHRDSTADVVQGQTRLTLLLSAALLIALIVIILLLVV